MLFEVILWPLLPLFFLIEGTRGKKSIFLDVIDNFHKEQFSPSTIN